MVEIGCGEEEPVPANFIGGISQVISIHSYDEMDLNVV